MAGIPLYPVSGTEAPAPLPGPHIEGAGPEAFGSLGAQQGMQLAGAAQDLAREQTMLQNQVRVNDALNQARQKMLDLTYGDQGYQSLQGRAALDRQSGLALPDEYGGQLDGAISVIESKLTPQQQEVFRTQAANLQTSFRADVMHHTLQQSRAYAMSVQDSTLKLAGEQAAQHWDDPDAVGQLAEQAKAAAYASGKLTGLDVQATMLEAGSHVHTRAIEAALENGNPLYAQGYLQKHSKEMTSDDLLRVQGRINQNADAAIATLATEAAVKTIQPAAAPTDMDRLTSLVVQAESGGHETAPDGSTLTSPKGAKGVMQVMDATASAPGFGIQPVKKNADGTIDAKDRVRVGQQYLSAMLRRYGNVPAALAAYNAGPDVVDKAIKNAQEAGEPVATGLWMNDPSIPKETRAYVAGIMSKYQSGGGAPQMPTKEDFVQGALAQVPNATPHQRELITQQSEQRYTLMTQARAQHGDDALHAVQQALIENGGDFATLQRTQPDLVAHLSQYGPEKYDDAIKFARSISKGETTTDPELYATLATYPKEMAAMTDSEFMQLRGRLSDADFKHFATERGDLLNKTTNNTAGSIDSGALNSVLKERLTNIGLNPDPKVSNVNDRARIGAVTKYLRDSIFQAQQQTGKKMSPEEISDFVDQQFQRGEVVKTWFGLSSKTVPALSLKYDDVPDNVRAAIDAKMPNAPEGDKLRVYWTWKGSKNGG
jgi:soluble lytic murein transglycosylase